MEALVGPFIEGWALGKYSGKLEEKSTTTHTEYGYLKYGQLVHDYKYQSFKGSESLGKSLRNSIMVEINKSVDYFLNGYFPVNRRDFNTVVAVPSSRGSTSTIQSEICRHLVQKGFQEAIGIITTNSGLVETLYSQISNEIISLENLISTLEVGGVN